MSTLHSTPIPSHVAIIMDGNGRWAKNRLQPRSFGHRAGRKSVDKVVRCALEAGVDTLSLFAFSTENWARPQNEIDFIMDIIQRSIANEAKNLKAQNVRMRILGSRDKLSAQMCQQFDEAEALTADCSGMQLIFALNYSGHWSVLETAKHLAKQAQQGKNPDEFTYADYEQSRPMPDMPMVDLLIRSSGEMRISNFHLWEMAYAELYFTNVLWPDFDEAEFQRALNSYQQRDRRFGGVK